MLETLPRKKLYKHFNGNPSNAVIRFELRKILARGILLGATLTRFMSTAGVFASSAGPGVLFEIISVMLIVYPEYRSSWFPELLVRQFLVTTT